MAEDDMVRQWSLINGHEFEHIPGKVLQSMELQETDTTQ